jgi:hypothetical protein
MSLLDFGCARVVLVPSVNTHYIIYITVNYESAETSRNVLVSTTWTSQVRPFDFLRMALKIFR